MDIGFGLLQQQQTKITMTPELRQSITILQYPLPELLQFLREKANENPLIELEEPSFMMEQANTSRDRRLWDDESNPEFSSVAKDDYTNPIDYYVRRDDSLQSYLKEQCGYLDLTPQQKRILYFLIGNLTEDGYLDLTHEYGTNQLACTPEEWDEGVSKLQQLEPKGVGARNLEECLLLQLQDTDWKDELAESLIRCHLVDLAAGRYHKIAKSLKTTVLEVQYIAEYIKSLNPKPGMLFHSQDPKYIYPDVIVNIGPDQKFIVQVNDHILPQIHFNRAYNHLRSHQETKSYLNEMLQQYQWIKRSVEQRHQTILKVTQCIVKEQQAFFLKGQSMVLKPLTLKQVAAEIGVHESTVSRATNQKYVQTPWGVFELKYFFSNRIKQAEGEQDLSSSTVKEMIRHLVSQEDQSRPLSDQALVTRLKADGVQIARRTVAKYREELGILSSVQRKKALQ